MHGILTSIFLHDNKSLTISTFCLCIAKNNGVLKTNSFC